MDKYAGVNDILVQLTGQRISPTDWDRIKSIFATVPHVTDTEGGEILETYRKNCRYADNSFMSDAVNSVLAKHPVIAEQNGIVRDAALEEAARIVENRSFGFGYPDVAAIHAKWIRNAIKSPVIAAAPVDGMVDRVRELEDAIRWALGEVGDFPARGPAQGAYWWRSELLRRARLTKPKTPHERVTIRPRGLDYAVDLDGTMDEFFINPAHAENYRLGLIETLKKEGAK